MPRLPRALFLLAPILAAGLAFAAPAAAQDAYSDAERTALRAEIRAYLLEHPEVLFEAVAEYERRTAVAQADMDFALIEINADEIFDDAHSWVGGNPDGDLTLVEFVDYRCAFCRRAFGPVMDFLESDGNIRFVVKDFPILGPQSEISSRLAIAVLHLGGDEAYAEVHEQLLAIDGEMTETVLEGIAADLGLDPAAVLERMGSDEITAILVENRALAQRLQINGTPSFVLGGPEAAELIRGSVPEEDLHGLAAGLRD
jgi:protein-disulfide isomerase